MGSIEALVVSMPWGTALEDYADHDAYIRHLNSHFDDPESDDSAVTQEFVYEQASCDAHYMSFPDPELECLEDMPESDDEDKENGTITQPRVELFPYDAHACAVIPDNFWHAFDCSCPSCAVPPNAMERALTIAQAEEAARSKR